MAKLRVDKIAAPIIEEEYTGSVHLPGTGNRVVASGFDSNLTGAFTIEGWYLASTLNTDSIFFGNYDSTSDAEEGLYLRYSNTDDEMYLFWRDADASSHIILRPGSVIFNTNQWHHIAVTRDSSDTVRIFLDGRSLGSVNNTDSAETVSMTNNNFAIGALSPDHSDFWNGYVSNFRIVNGTALYTDDFEVPTSELKPVDGTVLLCCQSSTSVTEEASGGSTLTTTGSPVAVSDPNPGFFRKFNVSSTTNETTGSVFFDGSGDKLQIADSTDFEFGSNPFTIEFWVYPTAFAATDVLVIKRDGATYAPFYLYINNGTLTFYSSSNGSSWDIASAYSFGHSLTLNVWQHIVLTRNGNEITAYLNGVRGNTITTSASLVDNAHPLGIGGDPGNADSSSMTGYISNFRICKGHAVYTSNFAPPTRELDVHPETVLLCCYDGENIFADKTGKHVIAAYGDRTSSPTPASTDSPIGITTLSPGLTRNVDPTAGPTFQGGAGFTSQNWLTLPKGTTTDRNLCGTRGLFAGSNPQPADNSGKTIEFITVSTTGNTTDFGDRTGNGRRQIAAMSNRTRGVFAGSYSPMSNIIDYVSIPTTGNAVDFGDTLTNLTEATGISNSTRGIIAGGRTPTVHNVMQYVTIPTLGNATDFGDLTGAKRNAGSFQSSTRGVIVGGRNPGGTSLNVIEYVTIASTGDAVDFGDISSGGGEANMGGSNSTRGLVAGGSPSTNTITYVTISTLGNSVDFGDNTASTNGMNTMATSPTRACMFGAASPARTLSYVEIATTGNALDFGSFGIDATTNYSSGCSSGHGGLS